MDTKTKASCVIIFFSVLIGPIVSVLNGIVLSQLWAWFVVPLFHAPELPVGFAIGLSMIVTYLTYHPTISSKQIEGETVVNVITDSIVSYGYAFTRPFTTLFAAWVFHSIFIH